MAIAKRRFEAGELDALLEGGPSSTVDDVSITVDGRRLDTADVVIEFFEDLRRAQMSVDETSEFRE